MAEERLTDDPLKKGLEDEFVDIVQEGLPEEGEGETYDEDLVGLTPTKLKAELDRRRAQEEKAQREKEKLLKGAAEKRLAGDFEAAGALYAQAALYGDRELCEEGIFACKTKEYTDISCFEDRETAAELHSADPAVRAQVLAKVGGDLRKTLEEDTKEALPLREKVETGKNARRGAFVANRNYYLLRVGIALAVFVLFAVGCAVAGTYIVRTKELTAPILTAVFGGLSLISLGVAVFFSRGLFLGQKLVRDNEKLSSTEDGARLEVLAARIDALTLALSEPEEAPGSALEETEPEEDLEETE